MYSLGLPEQPVRLRLRGGRLCDLRVLRGVHARDGLAHHEVLIEAHADQPEDSDADARAVDERDGFADVVAVDLEAGLVFRVEGVVELLVCRCQ